MRNILTILLIPLFMLGQCWPHSHTGSSSYLSNAHSSRPHVHLAGGHRHNDELSAEEHVDDHSECGEPHSHADIAHETEGASTCIDFSARADHDSDAIYLSSSSFAVNLTGAAYEVDSSGDAWTTQVPPSACNLRLGHRISHPPDRLAQLPIFLLIGVLRL